MTATPLLAALLIGSLADDASAKVKISWPGAIENATAATKVIVAPVSRELSSYVTVANTLPALTPVVDPIVAPIPTFAVEKDGGSAGTASGYNFVSFDLYRCPKSFDARGSIDSDEALSTCAGRVDNISMHLIDGAGDQVATAESKRCDRSTAMPGFSTRRPRTQLPLLAVVLHHLGQSDLRRTDRSDSRRRRLHPDGSRAARRFGDLAPLLPLGRADAAVGTQAISPSSSG